MGNLGQAMAVSDFTKLPREILVDLINYDNGTRLKPDALLFNVPKPITGKRNTKITAAAAPGSKHTGKVDLAYNRIPLSEIPGERSHVFFINSATKVSDLIPLINERFSLNLQPEDYIDATLPPVNYLDRDVEYSFDLVAAPVSLIFVGTLTLVFKITEMLLSSVIVNTILNGLVYPLTI